MWPDPLAAVFGRARRRMGAIALAGALAWGAGLSLIFALARGAGLVSGRAAWVASAVVMLVAAAAAWRRQPRSARAVAAAIEARTRAAHNVLVTAAELVETPAPVRADVRAVVLDDAAAAAGRLDVASLFPAGRTLGAAVVALAVWAGAMSLDGRWVTRAANVVRGVAGAPLVSRLTVTVTPPAYTARPAVTLVDPERIEALAGSRVQVVAEASGATLDLGASGVRHAMARQDDGRFAAEITAAEDGLLTVQPFGADGAAGARRVVPVTVTPDRAPVARITVPGKDLFVPPAAASRPVPVTLEASDDLGLASLTLTYTKVTGSGESFTFTNGTVPVSVDAASSTAWRGAAVLPLAALSLEPGDVLVYRAVVADHRPGRAPVESDAFILQVVRPGEALAEGFSIDDDREKYAISQQMVILKTERLIAKKATLSAEAFADESQTIAAEQKKVRAEFVFMMGGEFEDATAGTDALNEEEEAANEVELAAGRLQNDGRRDIINATRYMSGAAMRLGFNDPVAALPQEKQALAALQRAFTKSRYILRVLTPRERVDETRRLGGKMAGAASWRRTRTPAVADPRAAALAAVLDGLGALAGRTTYGTADVNALADLAEGVLRADPSLGAVAQAVTAASAAAGGKTAAETAALIDAASVRLSAALAARLPTTSGNAGVAGARLRGAVADALAKGGGQ